MNTAPTLYFLPDGQNMQVIFSREPAKKKAEEKIGPVVSKEAAPQLNYKQRRAMASQLRRDAKKKGKLAAEKEMAKQLKKQGKHACTPTTES